MPGVMAAAPKVRKRRGKKQIMKDLGIPERGRLKDVIDDIESRANRLKLERPTLKSAEDTLRSQNISYPGVERPLFPDEPGPPRTFDELSPTEKRTEIRNQYDFQLQNYRESIQDARDFIQTEKAKFVAAEDEKIAKYFDEVLEEQKKDAEAIIQERQQRQQFIASERQRIQDEKN